MISMREEVQRKEVESYVRVEQVVRELTKDDRVNVISRLMTIETSLR